MDVLKKFKKAKRDIHQWWFLLNYAPAAKIVIGQIDNEKSHLIQEQKLLILSGKKPWPVERFPDLPDVNQLINKDGLYF